MARSRERGTLVERCGAREIDHPGHSTDAVPARPIRTAPSGLAALIPATSTATRGNVSTTRATARDGCSSARPRSHLPTWIADLTHAGPSRLGSARRPTSPRSDAGGRDGKDLIRVDHLN